MDKKTKFYLLTIDIFRIELIIYPILFILQYGIGLDIQASFYLRFFYIAYFLIAFFYLLKTRKIYINF